MLRQIGHIDEDAHQIVAELLTLVRPKSADILCFARHCPESLLKLQQRIRQDVVGNCPPVVIPERQ